MTAAWWRHDCRLNVRELPPETLVCDHCDERKPSDDDTEDLDRTEARKTTPAAPTTPRKDETMTVGRYDDNTWAVYGPDGKVLASGFFTSQDAHDWIKADAVA